MQDLKKKPKYLVTFTVGFEQRNNINAAVKKVLGFLYSSPSPPFVFSIIRVLLTLRFVVSSSLLQFSEDFQILLFHYDGRTTEWDQFEWSKNAIHISAKKQTKWYENLMDGSICTLHS